jgi:hypothetical protein
MQGKETVVRLGGEGTRLTYVVVREIKAVYMSSLTWMDKNKFRHGSGRV